MQLVYSLALDAANYERRKHEALNAANTAPFVISLIGDTHAGKTSLVKPLLMDNFSVDDLFTQEESEDNVKQFHGTSANVCLFRSTPQIHVDLPARQQPTSPLLSSSPPHHGCATTTADAKPAPIYVFDMEGQDATGIPSLLQKALKLLKEKFAIGKSLRRKKSATPENMLKDAAGRRHAVNNMLPLLAYFVSDMVVFIDNSTFDNTKFTNSIRKFISSIGRIADLQCEPHLLLVSNKCALKGESAGVWDMDECLRRFLAAEDGHALGLDSHKSLNCVCLPDWNASEVYRHSDGELRAKPTGALRYVEQVKALQARIRALYSQRIQERAEKGTDVSECTWLEVFKLVVDDFPTSCQITKNVKALTWCSKFYSIVTTPGQSEVSAVNSLFSHLVEAVNDPTISNDAAQRRFDMCRQTAIICLAGKIALSVKEKGLSRVQQSFVLPPSNSDADLGEAEEKRELRRRRLAMLHLLYRLVDDQRVCGAVYHRVEVGGARVDIRCTQRRRFHGTVHRNPTLLFGPEIDQATVKRVFMHLASFLGFGFPAIWPGQFIASLPSSSSCSCPSSSVSAEEDETFLLHVAAFLEMDERAVLHSVSEQLGAVFRTRELPCVLRIKPNAGSNGEGDQVATAAAAVVTAAGGAVRLCLLCLRECPELGPGESLCARCTPLWAEINH
eukprot:TRINITY_DN1886_c0_g4_i2.p1 TRINITY_DN1886_c0_g4~~TRINITY_DN1886_c0_g4_i2.p1  ORF type:complete len:763 (+),score=193.43 TRINITY_DN1886_c0_g4_i2:273-2291(+)